MRARHAGTAGQERERLARADGSEPQWRDWGPYLAERAWGTVREDYSSDGDPWAYFPHDHARSRAYRWNEDGMAGFCDREQTWCLALALWNGVDPILKERMFGLSGSEGNHGEDVKEYWWYLDATPTHSWQRWRYHYPQRTFPYLDLIAGNAARSSGDPEYELADTGIFDDDRFWVVTVDYAKAGPHELLMRITVENAGPDPATLHVLPSLWLRDTWSWSTDPGERPVIGEADAALAGIPDAALVAHLPGAADLLLQAEGSPERLFCENATNTQRLFAQPNSTPYPKDGINDHVVAGAATVNPGHIGTKAALHYIRTLDPGAKVEFRLRLSELGSGTTGSASTEAASTEAASTAPGSSEPGDTASRSSEPGGTAPGSTAPGDTAPGSSEDGTVGPFGRFDAVMAQRQAEADEFYADLAPAGTSDAEVQVMRQAFAGLLWSKQFYAFDVARWLEGDPTAPPPPAGRAGIRNGDWRNLNARDVILMPDAWEYPWFASWDLAFHCVTMAHIDPEFAKSQLILLLREWYMHPNGQLPAFEWNFSDVNPPTHAWAALRVFELDGGADFEFLGRVFHKLLMNFTWWTNNKDHGNKNLFEGGFMGLDNIGPLNRSTLPPQIGYLEQADSTAWMAMYALDLLKMALVLAVHDRSYEDVATTFFEHFLAIAAAANTTGLWDEEDAFYYDVLHLSDGRDVPMRVRSLVGLIPVTASLAFDDADVQHLDQFVARSLWYLDRNRPYRRSVTRTPRSSALGGKTLLALVEPDRLLRILGRALDESRMLSPYGIRSISAWHREHPFRVEVQGMQAEVDYDPGESTSGLYGGNSNWRGPVWFPLNALIIEALRDYDRSIGQTLEYPAGSGLRHTLGEVADDLSRRLISLFLPDSHGQRPSDRAHPELFGGDRWRGNVSFYEYFHGDTGQGLGASHQTGWTSLVAHLIITVAPRLT